MEKKGVGASSSSKRREYRKFRKPESHQNMSQAICKFFNSSEGCKFNEKCRFKHESPADKLNKEMEDLVIEENKESKPIIYAPVQISRPTVATKPGVVKLTKEQKETEEQKNQLSAEIQFFKKRYKNCIIKEENGETEIYFRYNVTDPDWVFELKTLSFCIKLLGAHPIDQPVLSVPEDTNQCLPEVVRSHLDFKINEAIEGKYKLFEKRNSFENIGKSLIMWLDHSIMQVFVDGLRRTKLSMQGEDIGLKLVRTKNQSDAIVNNPEKEIEKKDTIQEGSSCETTKVIRKEEEEKVEEKEKEETSNTSTTEKKTEFKAIDALPIDIVLIWNNISGNVATLRSTHMKINVKCSRCGTERDVDVDVNDSPFGWRCSKCSQAESVKLRSVLVHQNNNILCQMSIKGCKPIDCILLDSKFRITCLGCDKEDDLQKINYGDSHKSWCRFCHTLMELSFLNIRFRGDADRCSGEDKSIAAQIPKPKKLIEHRSAIEEGHSLPELGACEHYKKSYRWFRFPCCGKLYPCDTCHEIKTNGEHEMKIANRMICGHCSKEQPFSKDKPCISCGEGTIRKRTQFWEGGKGCRDQTKMNKNDAHKFVNSRKKTVAKTKVASLVTKSK